MSHTSVFHAGFEPIPGYFLHQRLGAGGYGEVWSADAPGGLKKAIKFVYGALDERRASTELRSLQRIRQVHHPLLLSLERIEIVDGQLIIVTELAEGSLTDVFHAAQRRQMQGVPREQLLDFLRDAGDALDYLSQKHDLQHLDIKPGNLLIMADRIKVADFGLVKDLHDASLSIISGMTPTHAAPELFDGRPDRLSDLYSLAIVYQEMLTGKLPFDGKSAGELARQHLHQSPNLEPLPPADRRVVARALAKHPQDRYSSCRAFIDELRSNGSHEKFATKTRISELDKHSATDSATGYTAMQTSVCMSTAMLGGVDVMPPLPVAQSAEDWHAPLCMFIGVGGMGCQALTHLRKSLEKNGEACRPATDHQWLAIDTDFDLLSEVSSPDCAGHVEYCDTLHLKLYRPQEYRGRNDDRFAAISRRWMYNIPRSLKTEGVRPLAMLALVDHSERIEQRIYDQLRGLLAARERHEGDSHQPLRVYICSSLHGGTGSAMSADIGRLVRSVLAQLQCSDYFVMGTMSIAATTGPGGGLPAAAALATLCEIDAQMQGSHFIPMISGHALSRPSSSSKPFDWVTLVEGGLHGSPEAASAAVDAMAESLWLDSHTLLGPTLDAARQERGLRCAGQQRAWLRASSSSLLQAAQGLQPTDVARICCEQAIQRWQSYVAGGSAMAAVPELGTQPPPWSPAQTAAIVEQLACESLRMLRLTTDAAQPSSATAAPNPWHNRISHEPDVVQLQLERDARTFDQWLTAHLRPSYVPWKTLQRIALRAVERMMETANSSSDEPLRALLVDIASGHDGLTSDDFISSRKYLQTLASKCLQHLQFIQPQIERFGKTLSGWQGSLPAQQAMQEGTPCWIETDDSASSWRTVMSQVTEVLDATIHRYVSDQCLNSPAGEPTGQASVKKTLKLEHLLQVSNDFIKRSMRQADKPSQDSSPVESSSASRGVALKEIHELVPSAAQCGGRIYRLLAVPATQLSAMSGQLKQLGLDEACTVVPAQGGQVPVVVCDASDLNLPGLIGAFWRPSSETFRLAERLHTRCDVAWPAMDALMTGAMAEASL